MSDAETLGARFRPRAVPLRLRSDEWLARRAASGDSDAFAALYERHHRALYRYCRSIVGDPDDAADALQNAMTGALAAIGRRDERAPLRAWLFRIAHNEAISVVRGRRGAEPLDPEALIGADVEADADRRRRLAQLVADLHTLSERQRGALLMRELSGLGHAEIAAAFAVSEGAVKQAIYEARTALHDFAAGRELACDAVRRELSDGDGRTARNRRLRAHLRSCEACRAFRAGLRSRQSELAAIAPLLPAATAAAVLESVLDGGGSGGGGLLAGLLGGSGLSKTVAVGAATVTAGAGAVTYTAVAPDVRTPGRGASTAEVVADGKPPEARPGVAAAADPSETDPAPRDDESRLMVLQTDPRGRRRAAGGEARAGERDEPEERDAPRGDRGDRGEADRDDARRDEDEDREDGDEDTDREDDEDDDEDERPKPEPLDEVEPEELEDDEDEQPKPIPASAPAEEPDDEDDEDEADGD